MTSTLTARREPTSDPGDESWSGPVPNDGGIMFGWLGRIVESLMVRLRPGQGSS
jgi:hypothetical protein